MILCMSLIVWSVWHFYFMLYLSHFVQKLILALSFKRNNSLCISLVRQIGFPIHFISVEHFFPLVLIEDISQMWQDACHIWKYYIIKYYKMLVIFTYNDRHRSFLRKWHNTVIAPTDYYINWSTMKLILSALHNTIVLAQGIFLLNCLYYARSIKDNILEKASESLYPLYQYLYTYLQWYSKRKIRSIGRCCKSDCFTNREGGGGGGLSQFLGPRFSMWYKIGPNRV